MTRLKEFWRRVRWPLVWALVPLLLYIAGGKAHRLYREHQTMIKWINAADPVVSKWIAAQKAAQAVP